MKTAVKFALSAIVAISLFSCDPIFKGDPAANNKADSVMQTNEKQQIAALLDTFNAAAARADYIKYFSCYAEKSVFIGTDATEYWDKKSFMKWSKPYFDKGKAWNFTSLKRNIYFGPDKNVAWFDELLNTQMKICRGSGVAIKENGQWKVAQYVLSMTIPNRQTSSIIHLKAPEEDSLIIKLKGN